MTSEQRRVVTAVCLITGISLVLGAGLTFLVSPMLEELGLSSEQGSIALALPSIGSLLVVFVAGRLGDRIGHRRVMLAASAAFILGSACLAAAQGMAMVGIGLLLAGASATAIQIVSLGLLQACVPHGPARISGFTTYGMVFPAVYLVIPVLTGWTLGVASWRVVPVAWAVLGLVIPLAALRLIAPPPARLPVGEMWTPFLAGAALASFVQGLNSGHDFGWAQPRTLVELALALACGLLLAVLARRGRAISLSLAPLRQRALRLLLLCVVLVVTANTLLYATLGLEYLYGTSALVAALYLLPAQVASVIGAKIVAAQLMTRWGSARAGVVLISAFGASLLTLIAMRATSPAVLLVFSSALFSLFGFASITVANAAVMSHAPEGETGTVSAYRGAASSLGGAFTVVFLGGAISRVIGATSVEPTGELPDAAALVHGLQVQGILGAALAAAAALAFWLGTAPRDPRGRRAGPRRPAAT